METQEEEEEEEELDLKEDQERDLQGYEEDYDDDDEEGMVLDFKPNFFSLGATSQVLGTKSTTAQKKSTSSRTEVEDLSFKKKRGRPRKLISSDESSASTPAPSPSAAKAKDPLHQLQKKPTISKTAPISVVTSVTNKKLSVTNSTPATPSAAKEQSPCPSTPSGTKLNAFSRPPEDDPEALERYLRYRKNNNESSHKSRMRRKERECKNADMVALLESENKNLRTQLDKLKSEYADLKSLLDQFLDQKK